VNASGYFNNKPIIIDQHQPDILVADERIIQKYLYPEVCGNAGVQILYD
jgi:hypothetical protein